LIDIWVSLALVRGSTIIMQWLQLRFEFDSTACVSQVIRPSPLSVWPHLFHGAGHEERRGEQLKWSLAFSLYIGSFPCAQLLGPVHTARLGRVRFLCI